MRRTWSSSAIGSRRGAKSLRQSANPLVTQHGRIGRRRTGELLSHSLSHSVRGLIRSEMHPSQPELAPKPSHLAFGELAGSYFDEFDGLGQRANTLQIFRDLPITQRLPGGLVLGEAAVEELFRFGN